MLTNLPTLDQFNSLLQFEVHGLDLLNDVDDVMFHLGILSLISEILIATNNSDLHDLLLAKQILAAQKIKYLIGVKGYRDIIETFNHPMITKEHTC